MTWWMWTILGIAVWFGSFYPAARIRRINIDRAYPQQNGNLDSEDEDSIIIAAFLGPAYLLGQLGLGALYFPWRCCEWMLCRAADKPTARMIAADKQKALEKRNAELIKIAKDNGLHDLLWEKINT